MAMRALIEALGARVVQAIERFGFGVSLLFESIYWLIVGPRYKQRVHLWQIAEEFRKIGVNATFIVNGLSVVVGMMLAIQLLYALSDFGAESQVLLAIAKSVTREFSPLITGIIVAGRSGAALAAKIGSQVVNQEVDALKVMGIVPVRFLVLPPLIAMVLALPMLIILADISGIFGGALFSVGKMDMTLAAYMKASLDVLVLSDVMQGLIKSVVFAVIIALVGATMGLQVKGGAEGVGRATTQAVVISITLIVITDMIFSYFLTQ